MTQASTNDETLSFSGSQEEVFKEVEIAFDALTTVRDIYDPDILQELAGRLPYAIAHDNQAVLLETQRDGSFVVGMCEPANFVSVRNVARTLNITTSKLMPRFLNPPRLAVLLGTAYEQSVERASANDHGIPEDLSDPNAKRETVDWNKFEIDAEHNIRHETAEPDIEIGSGTGLRAAAEKILLAAIARRASDIHVVPQLESGYVSFRTDGVVYRAIKKIPPARMENLANAFADMAGVNGYELSHRGLAQEININVKTASGKKERMTLRFQGRPSYYGRAIVIRINRSVFRDFAQIGLEPHQGIDIDNALRHRAGLILVTGPTGSGKSNTLEAMLRKIEQIHEGRIHVIQVGNPIEFPNQDRTQLKLKTEEDWAEALKETLRMDPDIFSPGEFRDASEASVVFEGAATGHLTLTTLHTNNIAQTFSRLDFLGIERDKQAALLKLIVSQQLVPLLCNHCKEPDPRGHEIAEQLIEVVFPNRPDLKAAISRAEGATPFYHATGCPACESIGIKGRTCIAEVLTITPETSRMLRNRVDGEDIVARAIGQHNMITLAEAAARKLCRGLISYDEVFHLLMSPDAAAPEREAYDWSTSQDVTPEPEVVEHDFIDADIEYTTSETARAAA